MRSRGMIALQAELSARPPEGVYQWLKDHEGEGDRFTPLLDDDALTSLLARNEALIELAVARFGQSSDVARSLFHGEKKWDELGNHSAAVRLLILENEHIGKSGFNGIPEVYFSGGRTECIEWLATASDDEVFALFGNPQIENSFLSKFLECKDVWQAMDESRQQTALWALSKNSRMHEEYEGDMDGGAEYFHNAAFHAAWKLAETVPVGMKWANILSGVLEKLPTVAYDKDAAKGIDVAKRWQASSNDEGAMDDEQGLEKNGYLGGFQRVRMELARRSLAAQQISVSALLSNDDPAFRAAAYFYAMLTPEQIQQGFERDKNLAVNSCQRNSILYRDVATRTAVHDISWAILEFNDHYMDAANTYNYCEELERKKNPQWFDISETPEFADQPATKGDIGTVMEAHAHLRDAWLEPIATALVAMNKRMSAVWWFALGALAASVGRYL